MLDAQQDYDLIDAYENDTHTVMRFRRTMLTCDDKDLNITVSALSCPLYAVKYSAIFCPFLQLVQRPL